MSRHPKARVLSERARELAAEHQPLALALAREAAGRLPWLDFDDFLSDAQLGLVQAAAMFREGEAASFPTYAKYRIRGAIADGLRQRDVLRREDRELVGRARALADAIAGGSGARPSVRELAELLEVDADELGVALRAAEGPVYIDRPLPDTDELVMSIVDPGAEFEQDVVNEVPRERVVALLAQLPSRERFVLSMIFYHECTLAEIAETLDVTESRVSQIKSRRVGAPARPREVRRRGDGGVMKPDRCPQCGRVLDGATSVRHEYDDLSITDMWRGEGDLWQWLLLRAGVLAGTFLLLLAVMSL